MRRFLIEGIDEMNNESNRIGGGSGEKWARQMTGTKMAEISSIFG